MCGHPETMDSSYMITSQKLKSKGQIVPKSAVECDAKMKPFNHSVLFNCQGGIFISQALHISKAVKYI